MRCASSTAVSSADPMAGIFWVGTKIVFIAGLLRPFGIERSSHAAKTLVTCDRLNLPDRPAKIFVKTFDKTSGKRFLRTGRTSRGRRRLALAERLALDQPDAFGAQEMRAEAAARQGDRGFRSRHEQRGRHRQRHRAE